MELCSSDMGDLVESLTKNANLELNEDIFKKIKQFCRLSSENVSHVFYLLMTQLRKEHAEIRYIILNAINELFLRSYEFRMLLEENLEEFFELTLETNPEKSLPPPKTVAERVKCQAQCFIKSWHVKFGDNCKRLDLAYSFLKNCKNINLDESQSLNDERRQQASTRPGKSIVKKISIAKKEFGDMETEISSVLIQIENCFQLIIPEANNLFTSSDFKPNESKASDTSCHYNHEANSNTFNDIVCDDSDKQYLENTDNQVNFSLRQHGITDIKSNIHVHVNEISAVVIEENKDNISVIENLHDLYKQISSKYLPAVVRWSKVFTQAEDCTDILKRTIDLKCALEEKVTKFNKLSFSASKVLITETTSIEGSESDDEFEEVQEKEGFEENAVSEIRPLSEKLSIGNSPVHSSDHHNNSDKSPCQTSKSANIDKPKQDFMFSKNVISVNQPSTSNDWQDPELLEDIKAATGINLKMPEKRKRKQIHKKKSDKKESRTNLKDSKNTTYSRLYKKIFKK